MTREKDLDHLNSLFSACLTEDGNHGVNAATMNGNMPEKKECNQGKNIPDTCSSGKEEDVGSGIYQKEIRGLVPNSSPSIEYARSKPSLRNRKRRARQTRPFIHSVLN
ncbi:hypothetical protein U1Q18_039103, partial [Sarracenia purpurea var. burkii]